MKRVKPGGVTPLTRHIWEIQQSIQETAPQLVANGQKVVIVLATDGLPTDEQGYGGECITDEFVRALKSLEGLPVWLVVRLCTDEEPVTRFLCICAWANHNLTTYYACTPLGLHQ
mmetsp:Transcript_65054/g.96091  ORF Transcript_65054/g.96091 Transcript_65054/m.96091 type:complete len:115 (-) Transcript_65054:22-366(-)